MLKSYGIDDSKIFKIVVIATMSSGKSTFINALMGTEILPSQNQACTAKIMPILDNDTAKEFKAYIDYSDGKRDVITLDSDNVVNGFNAKNEIKQILIEGDIKSIKNHSRATVIIDTPGTNFSGDSTHQEETYKLLDKLDEGLILYIINATQFGINDDLELMLHIQDKVKKSENKLKILFVVNKIDEFDLQKEDIRKTMNSIREYIEGNGMKNPTIIPISALAAKLFRQAINREKLTRREKREFRNYYDLFKNNNYNLNKFAYMNSKNNETIEIDGEVFSEYDLLEAINNTGINLVENIINELLFDEINKYIPKVKFNKGKNIKKGNNNQTKSEEIIKRINIDLLKIYKDYEIAKEVKRIEAYSKNKQFHNLTYEKLKKVYDETYRESGEIMMKCVINKCSDNGSIKAIVEKAIQNIEMIIEDDKSIK
ncbi:dynamin family protein [Candidatus Clostridium helianthi]|uniref:Dynamin family protein n=1 Tax=Candidatus Clostridium helianthi TaxID=3381660 RepID=A0ABW8SAM5_9CLOT